MNRTEALTEVLRDPARSRTEKEIAARALQAVNVSAGVTFAPPVMTDATCAMLATLNVGRVADLNEEIYERHVTAHFLNASDPIVKEFRRWVPPSQAFLASIGMTLADWRMAMRDHQTEEGN